MSYSTGPHPLKSGIASESLYSLKLNVISHQVYLAKV